VTEDDDEEETMQSEDIQDVDMAPMNADKMVIRGMNRKVITQNKKILK